MPRGRPRKPVAQKVAEGTFRPDRDGDPALQVEASGLPVPPADLSAEALAFWNLIVPQLVASKVAAEADSTQLGMMCQWWARYQRYSEACDTLPIDDKGLYQMTVLCGIAWTNFDKIAARFGLTPSDRAKLRVDPSKAATRVDSRKR